MIFIRSRDSESGILPDLSNKVKLNKNIRILYYNSGSGILPDLSNKVIHERNT
jgi:hypothetical protein